MAIQILDENTINQIAAGEVVENAASVVKELIENSLDAGATEIILETDGIGRASISVRDDGSGIAPEELLLAVSRHATSKLKQIDDLVTLQTMGFRGEALASIASVSQMEIQSQGKGLEVEGGTAPTIKDAPLLPGTRITVRNLFYNAPVRKRFARSLRSERQALLRTFTNLALSAPSVRFRWIQEGEEAFSLPPVTMERLDERIAAFYGTEIVDNLLPLDFSKGDIQLQGFVAKPFCHRPNRTGHLLLLNKRAIVSPFISSVITEGYGTTLPEGRFPLFFLHLSCPTQFVDVNVHPQKREVRLRGEAEMRETLREAIRSLLTEKEVRIPNVAKESRSSFSLPRPVFHEPVSSPPEKAPSLFSPMAQFELLGVMDRFLFVEHQEIGKGIVIVDALRAKQRVLFEQLQSKQKVGIQHLLLPVTLDLLPDELACIEENLELVEKVGISARLFGGQTLLIESIPAPFPTSGVGELVHKLIQDMGQGALNVEALIGSLAMQASLANLDLQTGQALLEKLFACSTYDQSPDGKAIYSLLSLEELKKRLL